MGFFDSLAPVGLFIEFSVFIACFFVCLKVKNAFDKVVICGFLLLAVVPGFLIGLLSNDNSLPLWLAYTVLGAYFFLTLVFFVRSLKTMSSVPNKIANISVTFIVCVLTGCAAAYLGVFMSVFTLSTAPYLAKNTPLIRIMPCTAISKELCLTQSRCTLVRKDILWKAGTTYKDEVCENKN